MILKVKDLGFQYNSVNTLTQVSFSIEKGSITAILGPNGAGKTTLLKCLNHILHPQKGEVKVKGRAVKEMNIKQIAKEISYVAQKNDATRVTVFDAILMGRLPHIRYRTKDIDLKKVDAVMKKLNLSHMGLKYLNQLSGGELQKVAIARALVQETDLLLLDEPTSSLDLKNQTRILGLVKAIVKSHDIAAVMTMHDLNATLRYADNFICLKDGTIFSAGKINKISPEMVTAVYGLPVEIVRHNGCPIIIPVPEEKVA